MTGWPKGDGSVFGVDRTAEPVRFNHPTPRPAWWRRALVWLGLWFFDWGSG